MPSPGILRNLRIKRVALVDNGANFDKSTGDGAHIMLFKSADVDKDSPSLGGSGGVHVDTADADWSDYEKANLDAESRNSLPDSAFAAVWTDASGKKQRKLPIHDAGHLAAARGRIDQADIPADVKAAARRKIEAATKGKGKEKSMATHLWKSLIDLIREPDEAKRIAKADALEKAGNPFADDGDADDTKKAVAHDPDDPNCKCAKCMSKSMHKADDPMCKCADCVSMRASKLDKRDADIAKQFIDLKKQNEDLRKEAADAVAIAKAERDARLNGEMREVLKGFRAVPIDLDKDVARFRKMQDSDPDGYARTMEILKATDAQLADAAMYHNIGSGRSGSQGSAWAQIEAKAASMMEKSSAPLSVEKAIDRVLQDPANVKLVAQYRAEQQ